MEFTLRNGHRVSLRSVTKDDRDLLKKGFEKLSKESRRSRFFTSMPNLGEKQLTYLTDIDNYNHLAWGAISLDDPTHPGIGIARYIRIADEPAFAEAAVTVADSFQGLGLGSKLLTVVARSALENGITHFRGYVLESNKNMINLLKQYGATFEEEEKGVFRVDIKIDQEVEQFSRSEAGMLFSAMAKKVTPSFYGKLIHLLQEKQNSLLLKGSDQEK